MRVLLLPPAAPEIERALREAATGARHELLPALPSAVAGVAQSERNRFLTTVDRLMEAEMLLADAAEAGAEVAWCASWMLARGRLVVLSCPRARRAQLAPVLAGNPSPWQRIVLYDDADELRRALGQTLAF